MNVFEGTDKKEAAEMAADFLPDLKETALEGRKEARAPPKAQEGKASREIPERRSKIQPMNEFATNAMQWAYSARTEVGEQRMFYRQGKWVLLEKTGDGFVELGAYSSTRYDAISKEINKHNEELQNRGIDERVYRSALRYENIGSNNSRNNRNDVGQQARDGRVGGLYQAESEGHGSPDNQEGKYNNGHFSIDLSSMDSDYMSAVERGDMKTAQRMVDEAAKKAQKATRFA